MRCGRNVRWGGLLVVGLVSVVVIACERETRRYQEIPAAASPAGAVRITPLQPGQAEPMPEHASPYQKNAFGIAEGKRLFQQMNCTGCHLNGGGGIGPALMDDKWIYGAEPAQLFSTITQGRPNGMPSYAGKLTQQQVWQLVGYVQSMAGLTPEDASPGRNDDLNAKKPENRQVAQPPKQTGHR